MSRVKWAGFLAISATCLMGAVTDVVDSDGYYCVGPDYVAFQFGMAPPSSRLHRVHIVRLGPEGVTPTDTVRLPQFQVHGLLCEPNAVRVASWEGVYTITLDPDRRAGSVIGLEMLEAPGAIPRAFVGQGKNLGIGSRPGRVKLLEGGDGREYFLEVVPDQDMTQVCMSEATSRIVAVDATGAELSAVVAFRGTIHRECGHD